MEHQAERGMRNGGHKDAFKDLLAAVKEASGAARGSAGEALLSADRFAFFDLWREALGAKDTRAFAATTSSPNFSSAVNPMLALREGRERCPT